LGTSLEDLRELPDRVKSEVGTLYVVEKADEVYVLHVFQKKTQKTLARDIAKGRQRLKLIR
jgi:phage-related protein